MVYLRNAGWLWMAWGEGQEKLQLSSERRKGQIVEDLSHILVGFYSERGADPWGLYVDMMDSTALKLVWLLNREQTVGAEVRVPADGLEIRFQVGEKMVVAWILDV